MPALDHEHFLSLALDYVTKGYKVEELAFIVKPRVRVPEPTRILLKHYKMDLIRSESAPIDGFYLLPKKEYKKHA